MKAIIAVKTGRGELSTPGEIDKTESRVMEIANVMGGEIVCSRYLTDGTRLVLEI